MTPDQLFREPMVNWIAVTLRQESRGIVHKVNVMFTGAESRSLTDTQLGALIKLRIENAKADLAIAVARSIP